MGLVEAVRTCMRKFVTFSGRASRSEFWWFFAFYISALTASFIWVMVSLDENGENGDALPFILTVLAFLVPMIAVTARRLHDKGLTAWIMLISIVPFGSLALLILCALPGDEGANSHGAPPSTAKDDTPYSRSNIPNVRDGD